MKVWMPQPFEESDVTLLRSLLRPGIELAAGEEMPDPADYDVIISGRPEKEQVDASPRMRHVVVPWAGLPPMTRELLLGHPTVTVHNIHHNAAATAEMAMALLLSSSKFLTARDRDFRREGWPARMWHDRSALQLEGKTVLLLGFGEIGRRIARCCAALGMKVRAIRRSATTRTQLDDMTSCHPMTELEECLAASHVLINALPETDETTGLLQGRHLLLLREPRVFINIGRGSVIDEEHLFQALEQKQLACAGLDVWWQYPKRWMAGEETSQRPSRFSFETLDNVVMSPHRGGLTIEDAQRRMKALADLLNATFDTGTMPNRVDLERGY